MPAGPGVPFAAVTSTWPTVGKIHRAKGTRGARIVADCGRSFRDAAETYAVSAWARMALPGPLTDLTHLDNRCQDCVRKSTPIGTP